jgi:hypothetical protein
MQSFVNCGQVRLEHAREELVRAESTLTAHRPAIADGLAVDEQLRQIGGSQPLKSFSVRSSAQGVSPAVRTRAAAQTRT